jgi:hypothetical protein
VKPVLVIPLRQPLEREAAQTAINWLGATWKERNESPLPKTMPTIKGDYLTVPNQPTIVKGLVAYFTEQIKIKTKKAACKYLKRALLNK